MLKHRTFRVDGDVVHITNCYPRGQSIFLIVIAAFLAIFPLIRPYFPDDTYVAYEHGDGGMAVWLIGIFGCLSAAFWWSTVVIDRKAGEVVIRHRWGLFVSVSRSPLSCFSAVVVREDDEGRAGVCLEGPTAKDWFETGKSVAWGREKEEAERIARSIAEHLQFALSIHREPAQPKLHIHL